MNDTEKRPVRSFGGRSGRKLSPRQRALTENVLPKIEIELPCTGLLNGKDLIPSAQKLWLEIGFGGGEHVSGQAAAHPEIGILASEVFFEGVAKLLGQIEDAGLSNIRLWPKDGRNLVNGLSENSIDRAFILFPDPWPKARHQKRRIIQPDFLTDLARVIRPGGQVRFATDVRSYADEALQRFLAHPAYNWTANSVRDWRNAPSDHIQTRYQAKNLGDIAPVYYDFEIGLDK
ncbi:MAG: tRNA (guanosine(46)-N7)-methyltransferase TrmB [Pseudomonadota bacterium]